MEKIKQVELAVGHIRIDGGTQPRAELDETVVAEYAEAMAAGVKFPPCVVFYDGSNNWLADGFHRYSAAKQAGKQLLCDRHIGMRRDAILYSVGANAVHGLRRKAGDKRRAVETLLEDEEWGAKSNVWIAEHCKCVESYVRRIRNESTSHSAKSNERVGSDGRVINTANIGSKTAQNYAADNAHNDDISDETPVGDDEIESYGDDPDVVYAEDDDGNDVTEEVRGSTPATPQEQYAAATVVSDTITETPSEADENDLTDNEWLMTAPLFKLLVSRGEKALLLRGDMLAWRTMQQSKAFGAFRHHAQKAFNFNNAHTPLSALIYKATHVKHPREWGGCVTCRGKGCTECRYTGAQLEGGLTIEQMEAR